MIPILFATWKEIYRKKVFLVTLILTVLLLVLMTLASWFVARVSAHNIAGTGEFDVYMQGTAVFAIGLYGANFSVAYLSIFTAAGTISSEIESGLLLALLPRPVARWQVYLGKWAGYILWNAAYATVLFWSLAVIIHINMGFPLNWRIMSGAYLVFLLVPAILVSLTMVGSTYMSTLGNGILVILIYGLGVFGDLLQRIGFGGQLAVPVTKIGFVTSLIVPTQAVFQRATYELVGGAGDSLLGLASQFLGHGIMPALPSATFIIYAAGYALAMLVWGIARFSTRDV